MAENHDFKTGALLQLVEAKGAPVEKTRTLLQHLTILDKPSMILISSSFSREPVPPANLLQCGFEVTNYIQDKMTQLFGALAELTASRYRNTRTIGVIFYVTSDNMTWNQAAVSRADIEAAMGRLNNHWSALNIKFQICDTKLIEQKD